MGKISLTIDGRPVETEEGKTVLDAARDAGIDIPTICDHKDLTPYGACRMCIVEIEGVRGFPTSCTTPAAPGMKVKTRGGELDTLRNRTLELMLSGHPNACLVCNDREACEKFRPKATKAGRVTRCGFCSNRDECHLRAMALEARSCDLKLPVLYSAHNLERDDPFMDRDYNLCILCGRCWRICEKIHGTPAISIINRGKWARLGTAFNKSHVHSGCTFCGSCIDICPTGTLTDRYARWYGQGEGEVLSTCTLCPEGCSFFVEVRAGKVVATRMTAFEPEASLCALGRFGFSQILNSPERLRRPVVREEDDQIPVDWDSALAAAAEALRPHAGAVAVIAAESSLREDRIMYETLARALSGRFHVVPAEAPEGFLPEELKADIRSGNVKAALVAGNFIGKELAESLEALVVVDAFPSSAVDSANVFLPCALPGETGGSYRNAAGEIKTVAVAVPPMEGTRREWSIARDLGRALGFAGFDADTTVQVTAGFDADAAPAPLQGAPRHKLKDVPAFFRGHFVADIVPGLQAAGLPTSPAEAEPEPITGGFPVLEKRELVPNFHLVKLLAPQVAQHAKPGQFAIVMVKETSERTPFTLIDWNAEEGSITLVVEEVGRSSREIATLQAGGRVAHVSGPLGLPHPIEKIGTVALGGGCYGIGAIYPIARAMKEAGNHVIGVIEAASGYLLYMEKELAAVCDELIIATKDGGRGVKGGVQNVFTDLIDRGVKVDAFVAVGCTFMMKLVSDATRPSGIPTHVALNPIMVDGTGMCGACRISIGGETRFACVDGPMFDGHKVDWDELFSRRAAYRREEIEALPQLAGPLEGEHAHGGGSGCGCGR